MIDCKDCNPKYNACGGKEWYDPGDIKYCTFQNIFLIENEEELESYNWPEAPSGYEPLCIPTSSLQKAYFILYETILAELHWRLEKTKTDGELLCSEVKRLCETRRGADLIDALRSKARTALWYISGGRKGISYSRWKADVQAGRRREKLTAL